MSRTPSIGANIVAINEGANGPIFEITPLIEALKKSKSSETLNRVPRRGYRTLVGHL
jgi:hypothetical protein